MASQWATGHICSLAGGLLEAGQRANIKTVVKVPFIETAVFEVAKLKARRCTTLMPACYSAKQMLVAAALRADFMAPYFGRVKEAGLVPQQKMHEIISAAAQTGLQIRVLVALLRTVEQMQALTTRGYDCFTILPAIAQDLLSDQYSEAAESGHSAH